MPELGRIPSSFSVRQRVCRAVWAIVWSVAFRTSPRVFHWWRRWLLRAMGARIGAGAVVHPSAKIWAPWNLVMAPFSAIGPSVDCYNVARVVLGYRAVISQYCVLCTATHDYRRLDLPLISRDIEIEAFAWVCADVFIGPGVTVRRGSVIGARSSVFSEIAEWSLAVGCPARIVGPRDLSDADRALAVRVQ